MPPKRTTSSFRSQVSACATASTTAPARARGPASLPAPCAWRARARGPRVLRRAGAARRCSKSRSSEVLHHRLEDDVVVPALGHPQARRRAQRVEVLVAADRVDVVALAHRLALVVDEAGARPAGGPGGSPRAGTAPAATTPWRGCTRTAARAAHRAARLEQDLAHARPRRGARARRGSRRAGSCPCGRAAAAGRPARAPPRGRRGGGRRAPRRSPPRAAAAGRVERHLARAAAEVERRSRPGPRRASGASCPPSRARTARAAASVTCSRSWNSWSAYWVTSPTRRPGHEVEIAPGLDDGIARAAARAAQRVRPRARGAPCPARRRRSPRARVAARRSRRGRPCARRRRSRRAPGTPGRRRARGGRREIIAPPAPAARGR